MSTVNGLTKFDHANNYVAGFFYLSQPAFKDGVLSFGELKQICEYAEANLRKVFPLVDDIAVVPSAQVEDDFAGYMLSFDGVTNGPFVFPFRDHGIDVVN